MDKNVTVTALDPDSNVLQPESLPLTGRHLIEASAGTGKTFNITRIYLRLLLERKLDVKNILVMTFTRAATEELRGRIAREIRNALNNWGQFDPEDSYFAALTRQFSLQDVYPALHNALLHLDEAAIFTIHSFCKRVLSQQAFSSGVAFNVQMEADTADIELEAVRDWYRRLTRQADKYELLVQNWPAPENFRQAFRDVLSSTTPVQIKSPEVILENFLNHKAFCRQHMLDNQSLVFAALIDTHKQQETRTEEWEILQKWLDQSDIEPMPKAAGNVFDGRRYGRDADNKQRLTELFAPLKQLKEDAGAIEQRLQNARSYQLAALGIDAIRSKIIQAKQRARVMNYDDLINQLAASLTSTPAREDPLSTPLSELIRGQYPVALVDEFQDTDPQQYAILKAIYQSSCTSEGFFPAEGSYSAEGSQPALYMIGDPKQAIYAFRSGDVFTYLSARADAQYQWVMDTNWRSSSDMINAYNRLFSGAPLNEKAQNVFGFDIHYAPVRSAGQADSKPLFSNRKEMNTAALQLIYFPFNETYRSGRGKKELMNQDFCAVIASWCSSEIHTLLTENFCIGENALQEQDIAVLVRDKREAAYIQDALRVAGYPSVYLSSHDNVFLSDEAMELELALRSVLELENDRALVAGLSTRFFGCDTGQLFVLQENEEQWEIYRERVFDLRETWFKRGFMAMALKLLHQNFIPQPQHHERSLTNAIQLLELLQQASQRHRQPEQLLNWFREQVAAQGVASEAELRLESDANLIRISTQHGSKGLEYPVVFIPFATRYKDPAKFGSKNIDLFKYHERDTRQLNYFIGQDITITELYREEAWAETVRLLYVAVTRAEHRCYLCATAFANYHQSPLGQTLKLTDADDLYQGLKSLIETDAQGISLQQIDELDFSLKRRVMSVDEKHFTPASFTGRIERNWWLSSFSALTRNLRHGGISTPDRDQDEQTVKTMADALSMSKLRFTLSKGAATGNLLHDILEHSDFSQPHWQRSMERPLARFGEALGTSQQAELITWLECCLNTRMLEGPKLNELNWAHTLRETEFYFPMQQVKPFALGQLLVRHRNQRNNTLPGSTVQLPGNQALQGMMHGFIDLVFQWQGSFYIVDYKSSHLGNRFENYDPVTLEKNIRDNYYDLQYLLYSLALHRYLKTRLVDYNPGQHFGGVYYLYLRGMMPGSYNGVFYTSVSPDLLQELDDMFSCHNKTNSNDTCLNTAGVH
ncbi:MAG: exodeoxyribonuclease V subunit beta [Gammaproteobacteria bacterium]|nr:exodeoxyribonuclease V subunit beta [Gammaproteobacteria bacterium]